MTKGIDLKDYFATPETKMVKVLDGNGQVVNEDFFPDLSDDQLVELFKQMV